MPGSGCKGSRPLAYSPQRLGAGAEVPCPTGQGSRFRHRAGPHRSAQHPWGPAFLVAKICRLADALLARSPLPCLLYPTGWTVETPHPPCRLGPKGVGLSAYSGRECVLDIRNRLVLYRDFQGEYRWRLRSPKGETLAASPVGHRQKSACESEMRAIMVEHPDTRMRDATPAVRS